MYGARTAQSREKVLREDLIYAPCLLVSSTTADTNHIPGTTQNLGDAANSEEVWDLPWDPGKDIGLLTGQG